MDSSKYILLTVDVEDWFQVENFKPWVPFSTWDSRELRVERNVHRLLDLFDSVELEPSSLIASQLPSRMKPKATFFVLGWLAEKLPNLVREIQSRGHEMASHGYNHELPNSLSAQNLKQDLENSKKLLEDITGESITGYRAPSFAINDSILKSIGDCGYRYDSSYNSFSLHGRYGQISLNGSGRKGIAHHINENLYELPISNLPLSNLGILAQFRHSCPPVFRRIRHFHLPWGGGAYFRIAPYQIFRRGIRSILENNGTYVFYIHPWEFDPGQPRVQKASANFKFRHYTNLHKTGDKLRMVIESFPNCRFVSCREYLNLEKDLQSQPTQ